MEGWGVCGGVVDVVQCVDLVVLYWFVQCGYGIQYCVLVEQCDCVVLVFQVQVQGGVGLCGEVVCSFGKLGFQIVVVDCYWDVGVWEVFVGDVYVMQGVVFEQCGLFGQLYQYLVFWGCYCWG